MATSDKTDKVADVKVAGGRNAPGPNEKASASKERHDTDFVANVSDALDKARQDREDQVQASVEEAAQRATSQATERGRDGAVEAVITNHARLAADTEETDNARFAADLGNGYRVRTDMLEPVPPVDVYKGRRRFDVGGQPLEMDPETMAKSRAHTEAEIAKERKKNA